MYVKVKYRDVNKENNKHNAIYEHHLGRGQNMLVTQKTYGDKYCKISH
jgi:hypothetical protein